MTKEQEKNDGAALVDMAKAYFRGKALCAAVRLGIPDALANGERSLDELAGETESEADGLRRLLRVLTCLGVVDEVSPGSFALTSFGQPLRKDAPDSVWASIVFWADLIADAWTYLPDCVRTGGPTGAASAMEQKGIKSRWSMEPNATDIFHAVFAEPDVGAMSPFVTAYDFAGCDMVADLGGAGGALLAAILLANPNARGVLVDRKEAEARATQRFAAAGLSERVAFESIDLLESPPPSADVHILKSVLHGYGDAEAARILSNCRSAMTSSGRLLVIENVLPEKTAIGNDRIEKMCMSDLNMLAVTGGHERTEAEWNSLFASAGLELARVIPVPNVTASIVEAKCRA